MENKNIHVDGGHFRGLTRPVHADGGVSSDKVPTYSTRGPTLLERDIRENWLALLLLHLHRFLSYAKVPWNRIRIEPGPRLPNWRHFSRRNTSRRSREARRRYNDFRDENYVLPRQTTFPSLSNRLFCFSCRRSCIAALFTQRNAPFVIRDLLRINFRSMDTIFYSSLLSRSNFSYRLEKA